MNKTIAVSGILLILSGIVFGAFGAHSLKEIVSTAKLTSFETGVRYQLIQGLGLLIVGLQSPTELSLKVFYQLMLAGTILFCFSIYILTFSEVINLPTALLGPLTPIGGLFMVSAWLILLIKILAAKIK